MLDSVNYTEVKKCKAGSDVQYAGVQRGERSLFTGGAEVEVLEVAVDPSPAYEPGARLGLEFPTWKEKVHEEQDSTFPNRRCQTGDFTHVFFVDDWNISQVRETVKGGKPTALCWAAMCWAGPHPAPHRTPHGGGSDVVSPQCGHEHISITIK